MERDPCSSLPVQRGRSRRPLPWCHLFWTCSSSLLPLLPLLPKFLSSLLPDIPWRWRREYLPGTHSVHRFSTFSFFFFLFSFFFFFLLFYHLNPSDFNSLSYSIVFFCNSGPFSIPYRYVLVMLSFFILTCCLYSVLSEEDEELEEKEEIKVEKVPLEPEDKLPLLSRSKESDDSFPVFPLN